MNIQQLRYAVEIERARSINKAAQRLFVRQPNLSSSIKDLEEEINITIFKRNHKGVQPTPEGERFLAYAEKVLAQMEELESMYKNAPSEAEVFHVSVIRSTYIAQALSNLINSLDESKELNLTFNETSATGVINEVAGGVSEMGIVRYQSQHEKYFMSLLENKGLQYEVLWEFEMLVTLSEEHPLAKYEEIPYHLLTECTEIVHGDSKIPSLRLSEVRYGVGGAAPARRIYVYDRGSHINLLCNVKNAFMWVPLLPEYTLRRNHLVQRKCNLASVLNKDIAVFPAGKPRSVMSEAFLIELKKTIRSINSEDAHFLK